MENFICILCVILIIVLYRLYRIKTLHFSNDELAPFIGTNVIMRLDSIMYGVFGAFLYYYKIPIWRKYNNLFLILGILIIVLYTYSIPGFNYSIAEVDSMKPLGCLFFLPKLSSMEKTTWKGAKFVTFISIISYSMYLLHTTIVLEVIMWPLFGFFNLEDLTSYKVIVLKYILYWVLTIMLSSLVYICFERPMTNLREKLAR